MVEEVEGVRRMLVDRGGQYSSCSSVALRSHEPLMAEAAGRGMARRDSWAASTPFESRRDKSIPRPLLPPLALFLLITRP